MYDVNANACSHKYLINLECMQSMMHDASPEACKMIQFREACKYASDASREAFKYISKGSKNEHTHDSDMHQVNDMHKGT